MQTAFLLLWNVLKRVIAQMAATRHGLIRYVPERHRAGRGAWGPRPRLRTKLPLQCFSRRESFPETRPTRATPHRLLCLARPRETVLCLVAEQVQPGLAGNGTSEIQG